MNDYTVVELPMSEIFADPSFNCRGHIIPLDVLDLAKDIAKRGLDVPITVQPFTHPTKKWRVVAGHRREMAFRINKAETIPCFIKEGLSVAGAHEFNLRENLHRKALNILQEANALKFFFDAMDPEGKYHTYTDADMAQLFGQSRGWVQVRRDLLTLPPEIQAEVAAGMINQDQIKLISRVKSRETQYELVRKIKESKERGDKVSLRPTVKREGDVFKQKARNRFEINEMLDMIYNITGPDLHTRCLAWASGEISTIALMTSTKEWCEENKLTFTMPTFINNAINGIQTPEPDPVLV